MCNDFKKGKRVINMLPKLKENIHSNDTDLVSFHRKMLLNENERKKIYAFYDNAYKETKEEKKILREMTRRRRTE